ncbi:MAG: tetratricopeptide repeat protein [Bryobacteraceae bacterium]|jgi:tetratricopeptide (TPR) repeat protein
MIRSAQVLVAIVLLASAGVAQTPSASSSSDNRAGAYYNFAMARLYAQLAQAEGSREDVTKAIQYYQQALKLDPSSSLIFEELANLYIETNRLADAETQAQDMLKQDPDNLGAHRMLGRVYTKIAGAQQGRVDESYLRKAVEQYQWITQKAPKDSEGWVMLGKLQSFSNNPAEAEKAFNAAIAANPDDEEALAGLATLYSEMGDNNKAVEKLKALVDKNPNERTLAILAQQYEQMEDFKDAADALKKAVALSPDDDRLQGELAEVLSQAGQYDAALAIYKQLADGDPHDWHYPFGMARIYMQQRNFPPAAAALAKAKALDPADLNIRGAEVELLAAQHKTDEEIAALKRILSDTERRNYSTQDIQSRVQFLDQLSRAYRDAEQYTQAVDTLQQISVLDPNLAPRVSAEIVEIWRTYAKNLDNAMKEADSALKKFPKDPAVIEAHANVLADSGRIDPAAAELRTLLGAGPRAFSIQIGLAEIYERGKRWDEMSKALDAAEKALDADKLATKEDRATVDFMRGARLERMKKYDASEAEFRKTIELDPKNAGALNYLGYMLADRNERLDEAYSLVKKALDLDPDNGAYLDSMAWVYYRQGKLAEAEDLLKRALNRMKDPTVHDHLGDVYSKLGKTREAIAQWQASLREFQRGFEVDNDPEEVSKVNKKLDEAQARLAREVRNQ